MVEMAGTGMGVIFMMVGAAMLTAGLILATTLASAGTGQMNPTGGFLMLVGLPIALMMGVAMLVSFLVMQLIIGSMR